MWSQAQQLAAGWLADSELARLDAMQNPQRRQEFVACRFALRSLLARATGTTAEQWWLDAPEGSAPRLNAQRHGARAVASTHLTLSHSGSYLACAVASQPVGVDMEVQNARSPRRDVLAMASVACSEHEMQQLRSVDCALSQWRMFVQWWSLKEAYFKCAETGVDFSYVQRIECRPAGHDAARPLAHGRSWRGNTPSGQDVVLSACSFVCSTLPSTYPGNEDIAWQSQSDWVLVEC